MSDTWRTVLLNEVADIRVSNVDKKSIPSELPVHLCNYMDVYANDYVVAGMPFMAATATQPEIARFGLRCGDVMITKDSETPDDIGVPSVLVDEIENLVCGYHLALIRPKANEVCPVFLAKQLATERAKRYFGVHASGSTRFGIPVGAIESFDLSLPTLPEQSKIAEVLSTVDRAIAQTEALIAKQQRIKTGLMQDLLTRGIDEHGQLRSEATHAFKDSPLGRIPVEWEVDVGSKYFSLHGGIPTSVIDRNPDGDALYLKVDDFNALQNLDGIVAAEHCFNCPPGLQGRMLAPGTLVFPKRGAAIFLNRVGVLRKQATLDPNLMGLRVKEDVAAEFIKLVLLNRNLGTICDNSGIPQINNKHLYPLEFSMPSHREQEEIVKRTQQTERGVLSTSMRLGKLRALRTALMQDLLTGKVRVTPLLQQPEEAVTA